MINLFVLFFWGEDLRTNLPTWIYLVVYADVCSSDLSNCYLIILFLNLPCSLWFDLGTPRIILLRSLTLGSEQARDNLLNVNNNQQSSAGPEGNVSHLVLLCFVFFFLFKKLFVPACFYFSPEMADIRKYARHSPV